MENWIGKVIIGVDTVLAGEIVVQEVDRIGYPGRLRHLRWVGVKKPMDSISPMGDVNINVVGGIVMFLIIVLGEFVISQVNQVRFLKLKPDKT